MPSIRRRIQVLSVLGVCALSGGTALAQTGKPGIHVDSDGVTASAGGITAKTDGTITGTSIDIGGGSGGGSGSATRARRAAESSAAARRNSQFLRSRVEVLQKVGALRRWQASSVNSNDRQAAAVRKQNEKLRKIQQEQLRRIQERRKQQQSR